MAVVTVETTTIPSISADNVLSFSRSTGPVVTNVDQDVDLQRVIVPSTWGHNIGTAANPLHLAVSNTTTISRPVFVNRASAGTLYYKAGTNGCDEFQHAGIGRTYVTDGTIASLSVNGPVIVDGLAAATNIYVGNSGSLQLIDDTSTDPTLIVVAGGTSIIGRGATTMRFLGGSSMLDSRANAITSMELSGGIVTVQRATGTITNLYLYSGSLDMSQIEGSLTVTNLFINMSLPWAREFLDSGLVVATSTTRFLDAAA